MASRTGLKYICDSYIACDGKPVQVLAYLFARYGTWDL